MGRTLQTATMVLSAEAQRWSKYRRSLRREDQLAFDRMLARSKHHFSAVGYASVLDSFQAMIISIMLEQEKRISRLEEHARDTVGYGSASRQCSFVDKER